MLRRVFRQIVPGISKNPSAYIVDSDCPSNLLGIIYHENLKSRIDISLIAILSIMVSQADRGTKF